MRLYIDLDTRGFIESENFPRPVILLTLKRGDHVPIELSFVRGGTIQELADGATGRIGIKPRGQFASGFYLALDAHWQKSGSGESAKYSFSLNLNTTEIQSGFLAEPASVLAMLEIEWIENGLKTSSATLDVELQNDVNRGNEGVPAEATPSYPHPADILTRGGNLSGLGDPATARANLELAPASQPEMEAGTQTALRAMSPLRVAQAIGTLAIGRTLYLATEAQRLAGSNGARIFQAGDLVQVVDQGGRIERYLGGAEPDLRRAIFADAGGTPYLGTAIAPVPGNRWNQLPANAGGNTYTLSSVLDAQGTLLPGASLTVSSTDTQIRAYPADSPGNPNPLNLMRDYFYGGTFTVALAGVPAGRYFLYVFAHGGGTNQNSTVTVAGANGGGTATTDGERADNRNLFAPGAEGRAYLRFQVTVSASGTLSFTCAPAATGSGYLAGFQLVPILDLDHWVVLRNTVNLIVDTSGAIDAMTVNGINCIDNTVTDTGWVFADAPITVSSLGVPPALKKINGVPYSTVDLIHDEAHTRILLPSPLPPRASLTLNIIP